MPRPVAIEARHHLAQRLLVEDQQAAPPTGQVVEATAQRRLDAALRAVAQASPSPSSRRPTVPVRGCARATATRCSSTPTWTLPSSLRLTRNRVPSARVLPPALSTTKGRVSRSARGRRGRSRCLRAGAPVARGCRRRHRWHSVRPARPRCHPPAAGCVPRPCRWRGRPARSRRRRVRSRRCPGPAAPPPPRPSRASPCAAPGAARRAGDRRLNHRPRFGQRSQLFPGPLRQRQRGRVPGSAASQPSSASRRDRSRSPPSRRIAHSAACWRICCCSWGCSRAALVGRYRGSDARTGKTR